MRTKIKIISIESRHVLKKMSEQSAKSEKTPIIQDGEQTANIPINDSVGATVETTMHDKGKGVSTDSTTHDISMDEADSSSEDEAAEVRILSRSCLFVEWS